MTKEELFDQVKAENPSMTDEQIWTLVSIRSNAAEVITEGGPDIKPTEELLRLVLEKAKNWLLEVLPDIFFKVVDFFNDLFDRLPDWAKGIVKNGMTYFFRMVNNYFYGY